MTDTPSTTIPGSAPAHERPDFTRPEYDDGAASRRLSRAMMRGTQGVRALGEEAFPKWPKEQPAFYKMRSTIAQVARYYARTVEAITGMITGAPPSLADGIPPVVASDWENIDGKGTHGDVFARNLTTEAIVGGFAGILVDAPPVPEGMALTLANEQRMGLRPYWVLVSADQIINWSLVTPDWHALMIARAAGELNDDDIARMTRMHALRQVVIHERVEMPHGMFGVVMRDRYRVLTLTPEGVTVAVWEHRKGDTNTTEMYTLVHAGVMLGAKRTPLTAIPLALAYPRPNQTPLLSEPPLMGVAELNLDHYQITADRRYLIRHTHSPTMFLFGARTEVDELGRSKQITVGPQSIIRSDNPDAKVGYVSAPSESLAASKEERDELVRQIASLGMSFIAKDRQSGGTETARGRSLDLAAENTTHASVAAGIKDALEQALSFHAQYRGVSADNLEMAMHVAYAAPAVDGAVASVLWQAVLADKITVDVWLQYLRTGEIPEDFDASAYAEEMLAAKEGDEAAAALRARMTTGNGDESAEDGAENADDSAESAA